MLSRLLERRKPKECRMSNDDTLCEFCRTWVNANVATWGEWWSADHDWHPAESLQTCANRACGMCAVILTELRAFEEKMKKSEDLKPFNLETTLAKGNTKLTSSVFVEDTSNVRLQFKCDRIKFFQVMRMTVYDMPENPTRRLPRLYHVPTSLEDSINKIDAWLCQCASHDACSRWLGVTGLSYTLPTRLLELRQPTDSAMPKVRLVTKEMPIENARYATLSHCWGDGLYTKLTSQNLETFRTGIEWSSLSQTFQQAMFVCLRLGISYLWIDALCIIQDSREDWAAEAGLMTQVYGNSLISIAATDSTDGAGGLFRSRIQGFGSCNVPLRIGTGKTSNFLFYPDEWMDYVERAPLIERAWVLQERFIAPRVVHFGGDQLHWECSQLTASENLPLDFDREVSIETPKKTALIDFDQRTTASEAGITDLWGKVAICYMNASLSFGSDRPVALAGVARVFCYFKDLEPQDYLAALWRPTFILDLMWTGYGAYPRKEKRSASWSWLSLDFAAIHPYTRDYHTIATLVEARTDPVGDPFGMVRDGYAKIRAPMCEARLKSKDNGWAKALVVNGRSLKAFSGTQDENEDITMYINDEGVGPNIRVFIVLLGTKSLSQGEEGAMKYGLGKSGRGQGAFGYNYVCLVLVATEMTGHFRRIGSFTTFQNWKDVYHALDARFRTAGVPKGLYEAVDNDHFYSITLV